LVVSQHHHVGHPAKLSVEALYICVLLVLVCNGCAKEVKPCNAKMHIIVEQKARIVQIFTEQEADEIFEYKHGLPACVTKGNNQCRISLTFRQIKEV